MKKEKNAPAKNSVTEKNTNKKAPETPSKRDVLRNTKDANLDSFGTDQNSDPVLAKKQ